MFSSVAHCSTCHPQMTRQFFCCQDNEPTSRTQVILPVRNVSTCWVVIPIFYFIRFLFLFPTWPTDEEAASCPQCDDDAPEKNACGRPTSFTWAVNLRQLDCNEGSMRDFLCGIKEQNADTSCGDRNFPRRRQCGCAGLG